MASGFSLPLHPDRNLWTENAEALAGAYSRTSGVVRFELVTQLLLDHVPSGSQRVVDIGGAGPATQAIRLARAGHSVTVVDIDPTMLALARDAVALEGAAVQARIHLVRGSSSSASALVGTNFDLACCHSVLMYEADPEPMLRDLCRLVRPGGLISVLSLNPDAAAMRSGLEGQWREAILSLLAGTQVGSDYCPTASHSRDEVAAILEREGATPLAWQGVGIFSDHLTSVEQFPADEVAEICALELLAGARDPYRGVARSFHVLFENKRER